MHQIPQISNLELVPSHVPPDDAPWPEISKFALTFDAYAAYGSFEACAEIANRRRPQSLTELRACLFFEQRRWRHFGRVPEHEDIAYIRSLVARIRSTVEMGEIA